jgi:hypothetical protein
MGITMLAAEAGTLQTTFATAIGQVKTDVLGFADAALPVSLAIAGLFIAIKLGWKFFKQTTH